MVTVKTDLQELTRCVDQIEELGADIAWSFAKITNAQHALLPGGGFGVKISSGASNVSIWDGGQTLTDATRKAIARYRRVIAERIPR